MRTNIHSVTTTTAAVLMALGAGSVSAAGPRSIEGRYGLLAIGTCLSSPNGFTSNHVAIEPSSSSSVVNNGVLIFQHDGTGSASFLQTVLNLPPAAATFSGSVQGTFKFTYDLGPDGSMTLNMLLNTYAATYTAGPLAGLSQTFVTDPPLAPTWVWSGTYSEDRKTLLLSNGDTPSRFRLSNGAEVNVICQFGRVLTRLTP